MPRKPKQDKKRSNGEGGVWQMKSGRWRWEVVIGYAIENGKRKRIAKSGTARNETEAKRAAAQAVTDKERGTLAAPDRVTLEEWMWKWLEAREERIAANTHARYESLIRLHIAPKLGEKRVQALKPVDLRAFYASLSKDGLSARTVRHVHNLVYTALKDAVRLELVMRNIADVVRPEVSAQDNTAHAAQAWTANEAAAFIAAARGDRLYALFYLLLSLGLRRGEVCGLRWENVDLEKPTLRVCEALVTVKGKPEMTTPKTLQSRRVLRLPLDVVQVLREHRAAQEQINLENGVTPSGDWVFTLEQGRPVHPDSLKRVLARMCRVAGVRRVRIHDLRHTWASLARRAGVPLEVVSEKLGHTRSSFTADVYRHTFEDEHDAAALNLTELLAARPRAAA